MLFWQVGRSNAQPRDLHLSMQERPAARQCPGRFFFRAMPTKPLGPCRAPRCPRRAQPGSRYCAEHHTAERKAYDAERGSSARRGYGHRWRKLRKLILARDPICRICGEQASTDVDHVVPRRRGGRDTAANLQGLCASCHARKTATEDGRWSPRELEG